MSTLQNLQRGDNSWHKTMCEGACEMLYNLMTKQSWII
jgi:hypothetical protein